MNVFTTITHSSVIFVLLALLACSAPTPPPTAPPPPSATATSTSPPPTSIPTNTPNPLSALQTLIAQTPTPAVQPTSATILTTTPLPSAVLPTATPLPLATPTASGASAITKIAFMSDRDYQGEPIPPSCNQGTQDVYVMDPDGSNQKRVTVGKGFGQCGVISLQWHPEGQRLFLFLNPNDGSGYKNIIIDATTGRVAGENAWKFAPSFSPNGNRVTFFDCLLNTQLGYCTNQIFILDLVSGQKQQITQASSDTNGDWMPSWSPDGKRIVYGHNVGNSKSMENGLFIMNADGSGARRLNNRYIESTAWSPDGRKIVFGSGTDRDSNLSASMDIWVIDVDGKNEMDLTKTVKAGEWNPSWSPDSKQIVFQDRVSHPSQIYVINADGTGLKQLTTIGSNSNPAWVR